MKRKYRLAIYAGLIAALAISARPDKVAVQQPPALAGGAPLDCEPPAYPTEARRYELEGRTIVELLVGEDGSVQEKRVFASSGWTLLDEATLAAMGACRYAPSAKDGNGAGPHWTKVAFVWTLQDRNGKRPSPPVLLPESCPEANRLALVQAPRTDGVVMMRFLTTPLGGPFGIKIEKGSGDAATDRQAVKALGNCRFTPSMSDGVPRAGNAFATYTINP